MGLIALVFTLYLLLLFNGCSSTYQATDVSQPPRPDVSASGSLTGNMLDRYDIIAVLPFDDAPRALGSGSTVADIVSARLLDFEFTVVERARIQQLFEEQGLQLKSSDEQDNAIRIGRLAGAKAVVIGVVHQWQAQHYNQGDMSFVSLSFRMVDVETGAILFGGQGNDPKTLPGVPQFHARHIVADIITRLAIQTGLRGYGRIGISENHVDRFGSKTVVVSSVTSGSPAEKAGLRVGDIILSCNGSTSETWKRKRDYLRACQAAPGQDLVFEVARETERLTIRATAVSRW